MVGALSEIARQTFIGEFRRIDPHHSRILLIEGRPQVLRFMPPDLSAKALTQLQKLGVEVRLNSIVTNLDTDGLQLRGPTPTGVAASPLGKQLALSTGCAVDRAGRVVVEPELHVAGFPNISGIGDLAAARSYRPDGPPIQVPDVSPAAKQMGGVAARNVLHRIAQTPTSPFLYQDHGNLATIG